MVPLISLLAILLFSVVDADAARYWVKSGGTGNCGTAVGDTDPGVYLADPTAGVACMSGSDRLTILSGAYTGTNGRIRNVPSGTASNPTIIEGDPSDGHLCALQHTCKAIIRTSSSSIIRANHVIIDRIEFDGVNNAGNPLLIGGVGGSSGTCTNVLVQSVETWNTLVPTGPAESGIYTDAGCSFITFRYVHSHHNGTTDTLFDHGIYLQAKDAIVEYSWFHHNQNIGVQCFSSQPSPNSRADRCTIRHSVFNDNGKLGIAFEGHDGAVYGNLIYNNGDGCIHVGYSGAQRAKIHNNTCIDNNQRVAGPGIYMGASGGTNDASNGEVYNNIVIGHSTEVLLGSGATGTTVSHNACTSSDSCGTTGKVTITSAGQWLVDPSNGDFTLKPGTNDLVNAGTTVSTRPSPVGAPDIGAYERGLLSSAAVATGHIEVTTSTVASGLNPASGITGVTIACVGCTGTPVADSVAIKPGTTTVLQIAVSGISSPGTCTISLGSSNLTDSLFIAGLSTNAQKLNTVSGLAVSGTCDNTSGSTATGLLAHYLLNDGSGTTANDETVNNNDGTTTGITWITGGIYIPRDATYRHLEAPVGASTNPTTTSGATCVNVEIEAGHSQGIVFSSGSTGTNQRLNFGWFTVGGQMQWGISVQGQFWTDGSEFVAETKPTLVCMAWDAGTDTAYLWVNGVKGAISGKSVRTYTNFTTTATNFRYGNLGTGTTNNGGMTIREVYIWNTLPTDGDFTDLYEELFPSGGASPCLEQKAHQWQHVHTVSGSPVDLQGVDGTIKVVEGGAAALLVQIDCTGVAGTNTTLRFFYSEDGVNYDLSVPGALGAAGIAMIGTSWTPTNTSTATCCISGALTANNGISLVNQAALPSIALSQNHSYTARVLLRFGTGIAPKTFYIKAKQDNGAELSGGYTPSTGAQLTVISPQAGGMGF